MQTLAAKTSDGGVFLLAVLSLLAGVPLMAEVPLLVAARWGAFSSFVTELPVVPTGFVGLQRVVGGATTSISGVRALADSGKLATVCFGCLQ